ncbi:MAG: hypothetical protein IJW31_03875 [Lentisphaeria bacterium]|nr:hypothetical protein [Lentisphaeria bacterium]
MITNTSFPEKFGKNEIISADREVFLSLQNKISYECINDLLTDYDIPVDKKAFLYNIYNDSAGYWSGGYYIAEHIDLAIKHSKFQKKWQIDLHYFALNNEEKNFLRKSRCNFRENSLTPQILQAIKRDSASELEIARLLNNKKISLGIMYAILTYNAGSTINFLLKKYSDEIFSLRTPQEWLFTLCNYFHLTAAIDFIKHIEEKFPGIVKNAIDPWGNDLLWHTFYNDNVWNPYYNRTVNSIQQCLIDFGCDPNKRNALGLSFNSVLENTPEAWEDNKNQSGRE